jgi:hypothetical protein
VLLADELTAEIAAKALTVNLFTAGQIRAVEALQQRFTNQGGGSYSGGGREPAQKAGTVTDDQYAKMTYTEKKAYAESHARQR